MTRWILCLLIALPLWARPVDPFSHAAPLPSGQGLHLEWTFPEPQLESVDGGVSVRLPGEGLMGMAGSPDLPVVNRHIRIPATSGVQLEVVEAQWVSMGSQTVAPLQERLHTQADLPLAWLRNDEAFRLDQPWPTDWLRLSDPMLLRETRLVTLSVAPVRWNPVTGEMLRLAQLDLRVHFSGRNDLNTPLRVQDEEEGISDDGEGLVYSHGGAEDQFLRQMLGGRLVELSGPDGANGGALEAIDWDAPELPLNYLVFAKTAAQSQSAFQQWVAWKRQKGHYVKVVGENDLTAWTTTTIRNEIINQYQNSTRPPHYVALMGDTGGTYAIPTHSSQYDHYYAAIAGGDILADVVVGRISVESATQLATVLNKITGYEQSPYLDNTSWLRRSSWLTGSGHCGESMSQLARDFAFQLITERGYTQIDTAFCANSPSYVYNWFNQGISHYNYRGWIGMEGLSISQLIALQQGPRTPIAVTFTCSSGDFADGQSYTEGFLRGGTATTPGGAAAAMGFCTPQTHTAYNNLVDGGFWSALLDYRIPQVGTCMFRGKQELFNTLPPGDGNISNFSYWANLMGDPGMEQWCGVPDVLSFEAVPNSLGTGAQALDLRVRDQNNQPVAGVAVCAYFSATQMDLAVTDSEGRVVLSLPTLDAGTLYLTATKAFNKPARATVTLDGALAMPVLDSFQVVDASGDDLWTPGEAAQVQLVFHNASASLSLGQLALSAELADEASAQWAVSASTLPALGPLESGSITLPLELTASSSWTEGLPVRLHLQLASGHDSFTVRADLPLSTPALGVQGSASTDGPLYPGQIVSWLLRLRNDGTRTARQLVVTPSFPENSGMSVGPVELVVDSLGVDEVVNLELQVSAANDLVPGYSSTMTLAWEDQSMGAVGEVVSPVVLGNQLVGDPTGPDAHGYYAFESTDTQWTQAPAYNWIEIAPGAGGTGTVLNIPDTADEADASRRVELPFPFTVYGETYTSLAVCSNGFVAFGPLAHLQTDFRNHFLPCGMGPEPMIAPMWDDFKLAGDAQICVKQLEGQGIFVVEWYRMRTNSNNRINTFQLLLHDPAVYPTPTGDGEIIYQYALFDDTQSNDQDFPYCTVGLKNQDATIGLTLLNYHQRPSTAAAFAAGKAVRISTSIGLTTDPPVLVLDDTPLALNLSATEVESGDVSLSLSNIGQAPLLWQASVVPPENWPPDSLGGGLRDAGGPDSYGYTWMDNLEENGPAQGWVDMWDAGTDLVLNTWNEQVDTADDGYADPIDLPFAFPFYGETHSRLWVCANGFVTFSEPDAMYWQNNLSGIPNTIAPDRSLMVWWDDLLNNAVVQGYIRYWTNAADSAVVTWQAIPHFNQGSYGGPFTFQVVLESNGRITYNYGNMTASDTDSDSGTLGVQWDESTGFAIRHMLIARDNTTIRILPPFWLQMVTPTGSIAGGESGQLTVRAHNNVQGLLLPEGEYSAAVQLHTNDLEHADTTLPVTLRVGDVAVDTPQRPLSFHVGEAWPNPFNPTATLAFTLPAPEHVSARLHNVQGQVVGTLFSGQLGAGEHRLAIRGEGLASGLYFLELEAGPNRAVRKLTLLK